MRTLTVLLDAERVEERLAEVQVEFKRLGAADLASEETRSLLDEQKRLRELRTQLTRPPEEEPLQAPSART